MICPKVKGPSTKLAWLAWYTYVYIYDKSRDYYEAGSSFFLSPKLLP